MSQLGEMAELFGAFLADSEESHNDPPSNRRVVETSGVEVNRGHERLNYQLSQVPIPPMSAGYFLAPPDNRNWLLERLDVRREGVFVLWSTPEAAPEAPPSNYEPPTLVDLEPPAVEASDEPQKVAS